ncbi:decaprenyl-phosphate phosphoribosyltransferase [bacterium]|nr:decaprenyl-phosphate phosphoribosyltransferase [bacterium]
MLRTIAGLAVSLRPKQWTKNLLVFAGYLFTIEQGHSSIMLLRAAAAFGLFCAVSGAGYILNDACDVSCDRKHPRKCHRPIAAGQISIGAAVVFCVLLLIGGLAASYALATSFGLMITAYFILTTAYSLYLKHVVIVDLLAIAGGFVIRAVAGAVVIHVAISPWLLVCTTLLALFLGLAKRRGEIATLENGGVDYRPTLGLYSTLMLDQMLTISASASLMAYFLYTFTPNYYSGQQHPAMMATVPFVIYGLFRYLFLIHTKNAGSAPEQVLLEDKPLLVNLLLYIIVTVIALKI